MVDGDANPDFLKGHCFHGVDGPAGPNWAYVDLAGEYYVDIVNVFSRNIENERLHYFLIGLTDASPGSSVVRGSYHLCGQYKDDITDAGRNSVKCSANLLSYRYVIIQQPVDGVGFLTVCELEVYGAKNLNSKIWKRYRDYKLTGYTSRLITAVSCVMKCFFMCLPGLCHSINFQPESSTYELNHHLFGYNLINLNVSQSWSFYEVSYA
ncbi:hypothetical protein HELRODRAFT_178859 [Helobdella robusta]|uniref:Fucolectin tachylectin-4 pentraxin-1 domain-containing protein n=1 Tax=Helobdella robusta TaxID=6412 RepID=T1FDT9_HELRO|nr:hypothetical protein HELRODRAFT_178859 [Helobdella robusta]ESN95941.1 hypothetical protein HELRODRAFT_178859 [Helobdella robusta]